MWMRAKENYYNKRTGKQLLIEGKQYGVIIRNPRKMNVLSNWIMVAVFL